MSHATTPTKGPSTVDCEVLTDIHTQSNLAEVEVVSLIHELIPRYRLRADTDFACSNEDFIQTPHINDSEFEGLTNTQIRGLLNYYESSSQRISQMTKTYHDISAVTRMLEDRENDLQMAVTIGHTLLESNNSLRSQVNLLEQDIEQTTEIVKQLKHDLILKERLIRFYSDMEENDPQSEGANNLDVRHYEQKIRNLESENQELRSETVKLKIDAENYEQQEQLIVDNFVNALANANAEIDNLQQELIKKSDENNKQQDEIFHLSFEMREIHRRLCELKKENEELKHLLSIDGKNRQEYEAKIQYLEKNYSECLEKLHKSQLEVNAIQEKLRNLSPSPSLSDLSPHPHTVFLSPVEYANFMGIENSLKSELEEILEDPNQLCPPTINADEQITKIKKIYRRKIRREQSDTDGESTINDSAFSDTESLSRSSSTYQFERRTPSGISSRLRLVKRFEGSTMLKRWQQLAEPSLSSCLQSIPGVYTRAEILHEVKEDDEEYLFTEENDSELKSTSSQTTTSNQLNFVELLTQQGFISRTVDSFAPDPDITDDPTTSPASPTHGVQVETNALLHQVMQRLVGMSIRTFETLTTTLASTSDNETGDEDDEIKSNLSEQRFCTRTPVKPPLSPTFDGLAAPTPNTAMRAIKSSTFLHVSSLNPLTKAYAIRLRGEVPSIVSDFLRSNPTVNTK
ncbi:unnamed protein product [Rotaria socialis]|uniref:HAP1 N-terminal domain-containing protein n=1 Tax=Rotaria socialis TaxID=392032 RepID=A0A818FQ03_9BILA|nr:unnamed protein product [Rotaria socialis]CAF3448609.1 unnamed protein product [Rotaria socialis]CAF3477762.1 unnamed protein product [Rotaria socialis]CAF3781670.1 unnamed protein product [Rotaria socialis]CAF3781958.1 unnamed protein product [Rotaria socialis]